MNPIVKELICAVVIALFSQGIEAIRETHMRKQVGFSGRPSDDCW